MRRSKLELHLDILRVLNDGRPMNPTQIMYKVNICYRFLENYLDFLIKQNLVERKTSDGCRPKYAITQKGLDLLKNYGELEQVLQIDRRQDTKTEGSLDTPILNVE